MKETHTLDHTPISNSTKFSVLLPNGGAWMEVRVWHMVRIGLTIRALLLHLLQEVLEVEGRHADVGSLQARVCLID